MHSLGHTRYTFGLLQLLVAAVCAFCSLGWGGCGTTTWPTLGAKVGTFGGGCYANSSYCPNVAGHTFSANGRFFYNGQYCNAGRSIIDCNDCTSNNPDIHVCSRYYCDTQCEADSSQFGGIILECQYDAVENKWYKWTCSNGTNCSTGGCQKLYYEDETVCLHAKCLEENKHWVNGECREACNDHIDVPDRCEEVWKSGYNFDSDGNPGGGGYWAIQTYECYYDSCSMSLNCQEKSSFPAGNLSCDDFQDTTGTPGRCVGVMGYNCIIQCGNGSTINCDCDGECERAINNPACACVSSSSSPTSSSSSPNSSSDGTSSGETSSASSSDSGETSSGSSSPSSGSGGVGGDWEYDYRQDISNIRKNTESMVGYLSDIDRQISAFNFQQQSGDNSEAVVAAVAEGTAAQNATKDTLHSIHGTLDRIDSALNQEVETEDYSGWISSASNMANTLYSIAADTSHTLVSVDSMKADTSGFKSKYSSLFISNVYTREGCYTFTIKDSGLMGRIGKTFKLGASLDFGSVGGFDLCAILRGFVRACGAILCLLITIKAYRSAFSSSDG